MRIFLAPRSNETSYKNFMSTIESGVDYEIVEPHLADEGRVILKDQPKLFVWGTKETKKSSWEKMEEGDLVLFYKTGAFVYAGRLLYKQHNRGLGLSLWPPKSGEEPWTCTYFLRDLTPIYIPVESFNELSSGEYHFGPVQGFMPVKEEVSDAILEKYGTPDAFLAAFPPAGSGGDGDLEEDSMISEENAHREAQMLLLRTGRRLGYETFSADRAPIAYGESLEKFISLPELPRSYIGDDILPYVQKIDVIWFEGASPKFAFEVENSTGVRSGLHRLHQLVPLSTKLFIVAREADTTRFEQEMRAEPYSAARRNYFFRSYKQLEKFFEGVDRVDALRKSFLE